MLCTSATESLHRMQEAQSCFIGCWRLKVASSDAGGPKLASSDAGDSKVPSSDAGGSKLASLDAENSKVSSSDAGSSTATLSWLNQ